MSDPPYIIGYERIAALEQQVDWLRRHFDEVDKRYKTEFNWVTKAADRATEVANEFRGQLRDQAETFVRKDEVGARAQATDEILLSLRTRLDRLEGERRGVLTAGNILVVGLTIAIAVGGLVLGIFK
jgi:hypothetical protein